MPFALSRRERSKNIAPQNGMSAAVSRGGYGVVFLPRPGRSGATVDDPKRRFASINCGTAKRLFDHLVGAAEQGERKSKAERLCGFEIED